MKNPDAPFLEFSFYFSCYDGDSSLEKLAAFLLNRGAVPKIAYTTSRTNSPLVEFDLALQECRIDRSERLLQLLQDDSISTTKIVIENGSRIIPNKREFLVQLQILEESAPVDHNPVALWIEGEAFSHAPTSKISKKERQIGTKALDFLRKAITSLRPSYAAITVDYSMECPTDLKQDSRTYAFCDFYVANDFIGEDSSSTIQNICSNAFRESLPYGQIICSSNFLAPVEIEVDSNSALELSRKVGEMISTMIVG